jgi:hypothetical protein
MKFIEGVLALVPALVVGGCSPSAVSVHPLYKAGEPPVAKPQLEGEWISVDTETNEGGSNEKPHARLKIVKGPFDSYTLEVRIGTLDPEETEEVTVYFLRFVNLQGKLFFDAEFWEKKNGKQRITRDDTPGGLVPLHMVGRIWSDQDFFRVALLSSYWVRDNTPNTFREVSFVGQYADIFAIMTASTEELRDFLSRNAENAKAFADFTYFCRPGSDCASLATEDMLARSPTDDQTLSDGAEFFWARGNFVRAAELARHRAELLPGRASLRAELGRTLLFQRDFEGARREFTAAEQLAPGDSFAPEGFVMDALPCRRI